jgi:hypothetical protein
MSGKATLRKTVLKTAGSRPQASTGELDIAALASVEVSSEDPRQPVENAFDRNRGPGASEWVAQDAGEQSIVLAFDSAQTIRRIAIEVEEKQVSRSQQIRILASRDHGSSYDALLQQGFNFSPPGTSFEREQWQVDLQGVTHLQVRILPDIDGKPCQARLTALDLW